MTTSPNLGIQTGDRLVLRGPRMDFVLRTVPTRHGGSIQREVVIHPGAVIILPVLADGRLVFIRNHRHTISAELLELPAGTLEPAEDPALCAARELTEETGYTADRLEPLGWFYTSPGILTEKMYAFLATDLQTGPQNLEDNEEIRVEILTMDEAEGLIAKNQLVDAKSLATLLRYKMRRG